MADPRDIDIGYPTDINKIKGKPQVLGVAVTSPANGEYNGEEDYEDTVLATVKAQGCVIDSLIVYAVAAQTEEMTRATVKAAAEKVISLLLSADLLQSELDAAGKQVAWIGAVYLPVDATIVMTHTGTGTAPLNLMVLITYHSGADFGYLE